MHHFIHLKDISSVDLRKILTDAKKRKKNRKNLNTLQIDKDAPLRGKFLIQMFEKSSLRTRLSFNLAIKQLGGGTITLRPNELHLGQGGESLEDTAKILSTYGDGFMLRTDSDQKLDDFKKYFNSKNLESYFIIESQGKVIGGGGYAYENIKTARICWLFIDPDYHGLGFGKKLVNYCIKISS